MTQGTTPEGTNPNPQGAKDGDSGAAPSQASTGAHDQAQDASEDGSDEGTQSEGKTYTQAELDAIINSRIAKATKAAKRQALDEAKAEQERANMSEAERIKAEKDQADKRIAELEERVRQSRIREQLAGKVVNLDDAVRVLDDSFINEDTGEVDVNAFLDSKPYFRAATPGGHAKPGNPSSAKRLTREQIANMSEAEIEKRWDEVQAVLDNPRS